MTKRIEFVDVAKCFCIILVIIGHSGLEGYPRAWIYSFHMPFFFVVSGFFLKADTTPVKDVFMKNCRQLLVPYVFFYLLTIPFGLVYIYFHGEPISLDYLWKPFVGMFYGVDRLVGEYSFFTNGPLWFLLALFWARFLFVFNRAHHYSTVGIIAGAAVALVLHYTMKACHFNIWSLSQAFLLYPYLCLGYILNRKLNIVQWIDESKDSVVAVLALASLIAVSALVPMIGIIDYNCTRIGDYPGLSFMVATIGCIMTLMLAKLANQFKSEILLKTGGGTIVYLAVHHPVMDVFKFILVKLGMDISGGNIFACLLSAAITVIACYPILLFCEKYCPRMIGKR